MPDSETISLVVDYRRDLFERQGRPLFQANVNKKKQISLVAIVHMSNDDKWTREKGEFTAAAILVLVVARVAIRHLDRMMHTAAGPAADLRSGVDITTVDCARGGSRASEKLVRARAENRTVSP